MGLEYNNDQEGERGEIRKNDEPPRVAIPLPKYTITIIAMTAFVFAVQMYVGLDNSYLAAGFVKPAFFAGEYWRIMTGAMLHGFILHIVMNCYAFYSFGKFFEMLTNPAHLAIVFVLSAIGGGALSAFFVPDGLSVGASGGIVGLIGYLLIYAFRRRQFISAEFRKSLLINIGFILIFGLVLYQIVDNWGHIGGLVAGAVYAFIQVPADPMKDPREASGFAKAAGIASLAVCFAASVLAIYLMLSF